MSCESKRTKAYDDDLCWRMVYQARVQSLPQREIAKNLCVDQSTVSRTVALFDDTGDVKKRKHPSNPGTACLTDHDKLEILEAVIDQPGIYLRELQHRLVHTTGTQVDVSTICRFLHGTGFTRQAMIVFAIQRSEVLRSQYLLDMSVFSGHSEMLVFVDETGTDRRDCMRLSGYSLRGRRAISRKLLVRGQRVSAIAAMSCDGVLDLCTATGSVDAVKFEEFIENCLLPQLQPFNGTNARSVVVVDNASIHHAEGIVELIQSTGALVHFLPPYSPDLMPIEELFSKIKAVLKANESTLDYIDIETLLLAAFCTITPDDCKNWIAHAGYN